MFRISSRILLVVLVVVSTACMMRKSEQATTIPEVKHRDWATLRTKIKEYETVRADPYQRSLLVIQSQLQALVDGHSNDRIGDEALYYVGRIYYDIRDYHDARVTFNRHRDFFPTSEFAPTIAALENEMARTDEEYQKWLEVSRSTISVR